MKQFKLPDLGEGLTEAEIVEWHVSEGEEVAVDQLLVSMETAKAVVDVPSPFAGKVLRLLGQPGDLIATGQVLVELESSEAAESSQTPSETEQTAGTVVGRIEQQQTNAREDQFWLGGERSSPSSDRIQAMPHVRALARQLGIDLASLAGRGVITEQDVKAAFEAQPGHFELLKGARRSMAQTMTASFSQVAPVTLHDVADLSGWSPGEDTTVRLIRAIAAACEAEPSLNAWFDGPSMSRRLFEPLHLGIAIDSEHGLYVPVIEDVTALGPADIRSQLNELIDQVQARRLPVQSQAATLTLSNFGSIAGRFATPAITPPQVAIVGAGRIYQQPVEVEGHWHSHSTLPLSLTFDHRACTGGEAGRFMRALVAALEM